MSIRTGSEERNGLGNDTFLLVLESKVGEFITHSLPYFMSGIRYLVQPTRKDIVLPFRPFSEFGIYPTCTSALLLLAARVRDHVHEGPVSTTVTTSSWKVQKEIRRVVRKEIPAT